MRAVRFHRFGGVDVLQIDDVPVGEPGRGELRVRVRTAAAAPGEVAIREGVMDPSASLPSGQGTELAGVVSAVGPGVSEYRVGDAVLGWSDGRNAQADEAVLAASNVVSRPDQLDWPTAAALISPGATATSMVRSVGVAAGDTVVVAGGAGGVGFVAVQLAVRAGATVIATARDEDHDALRAVSAIPVRYGDGVEQRIRAAAPDGVDAFLDTHGGGQADVAVALGVAPDRVDTTIDFAAGERLGIHTDGMYQLDDLAGVVAQFAHLVAVGEVRSPVKAVFALEQVRDAYRAITDAAGVGRVVVQVSTDDEA